MKRALLWLALAGLLAATPARAELRALLIGIDRYAVKRPQLLGAVNDALGLAEALRRRGVGDITLLTEDRATRAAFEAAWGGLVARAGAGDILLLSFAGHGIRTPETGPVRRTPDGYDKGFVLAPYDERTAGEEVLRDEHLYDLFSAAARKGLRIVFVADACHSGAGIRGIGAAGGLPTREVAFQAGAGAGVTPPAGPAGGGPEGRPAISGVAVFSATEQQFVVKEFALGEGAEKKPHGALSYAVALGLAGAADDAGRGQVTAGQLRRYVGKIVRSATANAQTPRLLVPDEDVVLTSADRRDETPPLPALALVRLSVEGESSSDIRGVQETENPRDAEIVWSVEREEVRAAAGDRIAAGIGPGRIQAVVSAQQVLAALRRAMEARGVPLGTAVRVVAPGGGVRPPSDAALPAGATIRIESEPTAFRYFTVLDVTGDGTLQFVYPLNTPRFRDPVEWTSEEPFHLDAPVTPPFGADVFVVIATSRPLSALHQALAKANDTTSAGALYGMLSRALQGQPYRIGLQAAYTCARLRGDGTCEP